MTRWISLAPALLVLGGCIGDTTVRVAAPPAAQGENVLASLPRLQVKLASVADADVRGRTVGDRQAAFGVPMGDVAIGQDVGATVRESLAADFRAAGHAVVTGGEDVTVTDAVRTLDVHTNTTVLYWDVVGSIGIVLAVQGSGPGRELEYAAERTERTYVFPGKEIMQRVLAQCLADVHRQMSSDAAFAAALRAAAGRTAGG